MRRDEAEAALKVIIDEHYDVFEESALQYLFVFAVQSLMKTKTPQQIQEIVTEIIETVQNGE